MQKSKATVKKENIALVTVLCQNSGWSMPNISEFQLFILAYDVHRRKRKCKDKVYVSQKRRYKTKHFFPKIRKYK